MRDCPSRIGGARVVCFTPIDARHSHTHNTSHVVHGEVIGPVAGLAIVESESGGAFYLFGCDTEWNALSDTWHETIDAARAQAEFEYKGVTKTWVTRPPGATALVEE